jgi:hypothetical protein
MLSSINTIADIETLYARLGERDYEAVMSYLADDIVWIVADNSPLADRAIPLRSLLNSRSLPVGVLTIVAKLTINVCILCAITFKGPFLVKLVSPILVIRLVTFQIRFVTIIPGNHILFALTHSESHR